MAKTKIRINSAGVAALLKSAEVANDMAARAERIKSALPVSDGEEWFITNLVGDRASTIVGTNNNSAKIAAANLALQRATSAGR